MWEVAQRYKHGTSIDICSKICHISYAASPLSILNMRKLIRDILDAFIFFDMNIAASTSPSLTREAFPTSYNRIAYRILIPYKATKPNIEGAQLNLEANASWVEWPWTKQQ